MSGDLVFPVALALAALGALVALQKLQHRFLVELAKIVAELHRQGREADDVDKSDDPAGAR